MTVTSQVSGFPASQGTRERPSGRFPSDRLRPSGSLVHEMPAETIARATKSFRAWCLAGLPGAFLQTKPCSPCASTRAPHYYYYRRTCYQLSWRKIDAQSKINWSMKLMIPPSSDARLLVYHSDRQALSTARFCRAVQLATADTTCSFNWYVSYVG